MPEGKPQLRRVVKPWRQKLGQIQEKQQQRFGLHCFLFKSEHLKLNK